MNYNIVTPKEVIKDDTIAKQQEFAAFEAEIQELVDEEKRLESIFIVTPADMRRQFTI